MKRYFGRLFNKDDIECALNLVTILEKVYIFLEIYISLKYEYLITFYQGIISHTWARVSPDMPILVSDMYFIALYGSYSFILHCKYMYIMSF